MMFSFLKKMTSRSLGLLIAGCWGFLLGPFAAIGRALAFCQEELVDGVNICSDGLPLGLDMLFLFPITMAVGCIYGLIRGIIYGAQKGVVESLFFPKELFSFSTWLDKGRLTEMLSARFSDHKDIKRKGFVTYETAEVYYEILATIKRKEYRGSSVHSRMIDGALQTVLSHEKNKALLPPEVISHIASFLDTKSGSQLLTLNKQVARNAQEIEKYTASKCNLPNRWLIRRDQKSERDDLAKIRTYDRSLNRPCF